MFIILHALYTVRGWQFFMREIRAYDFFHETEEIINTVTSCDHLPLFLTL